MRCPSRAITVALLLLLIKVYICVAGLSTFLLQNYPDVRYFRTASGIIVTRPDLPAHQSSPSAIPSDHDSCQLSAKYPSPRGPATLCSPTFSLIPRVPTLPRGSGARTSLSIPPSCLRSHSPTPQPHHPAPTTATRCQKQKDLQVSCCKLSSLAQSYHELFPSSATSISQSSSYPPAMTQRPHLIQPKSEIFPWRQLWLFPSCIRLADGRSPETELWSLLIAHAPDTQAMRWHLNGHTLTVILQA